MPDIPLIQTAQSILDQVINIGDTVIDATVGNGHDTLYLANKVGRQGKVYGFDIQQSALDTCYQRLKDNNVLHQVSLHHAGHEVMPVILPERLHIEQINAIMFNLGYLPGGDKAKTTHSSTTLSALVFALQALKCGGIISLIAYTGHTGGREECETIKSWIATLDQQLYKTSITIPENKNHSPPELVIIRKQ